ncbi:MAG: phenylalanine--tRNA ligase subunit alpha [Simkaniaceae bacterium]|nr:phenylalanine--tRNA ligase subunit alpha [Simkaniaceae bacterium]
MSDEIESIRCAFSGEIRSASDLREIEAIKVRYLGKKGVVQELMRRLRELPSDLRPEIGKGVNLLKGDIADAIAAKLEQVEEEVLERRLVEEEIDVTLPGRRPFVGRKHPLSQMVEEVVGILVGMGFSVQLSPEIETEYYNYGGLNYPEDHPARDMQDTFYITKDVLLRSHTTTIQQHIMETHRPPIRVLSVGKCYRNETVTARSHVLFHQVDGLYIEKGVTFADLLALLKELYTELFRERVEIRVRPSYFPFVEPGMEVDIRCTKCSGEGCGLCKETGWLEVCGAGMVRPKVLSEGGIDPDTYTGYAFGGGIERVLQLRSGIADIRFFTENDLRFLAQFPAIA